MVRPSIEIMLFFKKFFGSTFGSWFNFVSLTTLGIQDCTILAPHLNGTKLQRLKSAATTPTSAHPSLSQIHPPVLVCVVTNDQFRPTSCPVMPQAAEDLHGWWKQSIRCLGWFEKNKQKETHNHKTFTDMVFICQTELNFGVLASFFFF